MAGMGFIWLTRRWFMLNPLQQMIPLGRLTLMRSSICKMKGTGPCHGAMSRFDTKYTEVFEGNNHHVIIVYACVRGNLMILFNLKRIGKAHAYLVASSSCFVPVARSSKRCCWQCVTSMQESQWKQSWLASGKQLIHTYYCFIQELWKQIHKRNVCRETRFRIGMDRVYIYIGFFLFEASSKTRIDVDMDVASWHLLRWTPADNEDLLRVHLGWLNSARPDLQ